MRYAASAYHGDDAKGQTIIQVAPVSNGDAHATIVELACGAREDAAEAIGCAVRPAGISGWTQGALVVDIPAAEAAKMRQDEIRSACGPLGLDQGSQRFWRVFQGHVWLFDLGQEAPDVDPGSLTLVRRMATEAGRDGPDAGLHAAADGIIWRYRDGRRGSWGTRQGSTPISRIRPISPARS